ncbi:MAG: tetratricopeptide repeat protein [Gemmataceae bacterium]
MKLYWPALLGAIVGVCVSAAVLYFPGESRLGDQPVLGLFGWPRVLLTHVLATLPLSLQVSLALRKGYVPQRSWRSVAMIVFVGVFFVVGFRVAGESMGAFVDPEGRSYFVRLLLRTACCLGLQVPWCLLGLVFVRGSANHSQSEFPSWAAWTLAIAVGVVLPGVYTFSVIRSETGRLQQLPRWFAKRVLQRVQELGSNPVIQGTRARDILDKLTWELNDYEKVVARPVAPEATVEQRLERGNQLVALGRYTQAESLLKKLSSDNSRANLLLGSLYQAQKNWDASSGAYRKALSLFDSTSGKVKEQVIAYNGLAFNFRELGKYAKAANVYHEAMEQLPSAKALFHFQLGRHYESTGQLRKAARHFEQAAKLAPDQFGKQSRDWITAINQKSPSCFLGLGPLD